MSNDSFPQVERWLETLENQGRADSTVKAYRSNINQFTDWVQVNHGATSATDVSRNHVEWFLNHSDEEGYSPKTINNRFNAIRAFYRWLWKQHDDGSINFSLNVSDDWNTPVEHIEPRELDSLSGKTKKKQEVDDKGAGIYLKDEEIQALLESVPEPVIRNRLIISLMYECGMREAEVRHLQLGDIQPSANGGTVQIPACKNDDDDREGTFSKTVKDLHQKWVFEGGRAAFKHASNSQFLFVSRKSGQMSKGLVNRMLRSAAKNAGIQSTYGEKQNGQPCHRITSHALRRAFAMRLHERGVAIRTISEALGHNDVTVTQDYLGIGDDEVTDTLRDYSPTV